jgi:hypothetical protein
MLGCSAPTQDQHSLQAIAGRQANPLWIGGWSCFAAMTNSGRRKVRKKEEELRIA